jgi:nucleotide-binding universal stress UspA family protein
MSAYRILVAIDLKPGTERLLAEAQRYAKALDAIVDIIHVADPDPDFVGYIKSEQQPETGGGYAASNYDQTLRDDRAKEFRSEHQQTQAIAAQMRAAGIRVDQALTVQGPALETILEEASKNLVRICLSSVLISTAPSIVSGMEMLQLTPPGWRRARYLSCPS